MEPVHAARLLAGLHTELIVLLRGLAPDDWERGTSAGSWRVRDVVAHLLDVELRRLSIARDGHRPPLDRPIDGYADLLGYLNDLNARWVDAAKRIGPTVLVDLLAHVGPQAAASMESLDPFAPATFGVAWAGQETSPNWLDIGREYTERWHHQDQLREAVGAPPLTAESWLRPVLEVSLWALPHAYRAIDAREGTAVAIETTGSVNGAWSLVREASGWALYADRAPDPACRITADAAVAARLLMHRLPPDGAAGRVEVGGDARLGRPFLDARAVMV